MAYLEPCIIPAYSEPYHIQNPGIIRTQNILRTLPRHILAYSARCVTLAFWKPCHIQNFAIFRIPGNLGLKGYLESYLFRHIQTYSIMITLTSFSSLFSYFSMEYTKTCMLFYYNDANFNASPSLFKQYNLWKKPYNRINKTHVFLKTKFYDRK